MDSEIEIDKFGVFFGAHLKEEQIDWLMATKTRKDTWAAEADLAGKKWFDYRFINPVAATYLFARTYGQVYPRLYKRHIDHTIRIEPFRVLDVFQLNAATVSGLWNARQHADACGMPYELYIEFVMEAGFRYRRNYMPRPNQLYTESGVKAALKEWAARQEATFFMAADPRYRLDRYRAAPAQKDHIKWVLQQIGKRPQPAELLARCVYHDPVLPEAIARARFGAAMLERAREIPH